MNKGTIILTPFPFTDLRGSKVRPAVILSTPQKQGKDIIVAFVSSVVDEKRITPFDIIIEPSSQNFSTTGLKFRSILKCDKIATIDKNILVGELGKLDEKTIILLESKLILLFEINKNNL